MAFVTHVGGTFQPVRVDIEDHIMHPNMLRCRKSGRRGAGGESARQPGYRRRHTGTLAGKRGAGGQKRFDRAVLRVANLYLSVLSIQSD